MWKTQTELYFYWDTFTHILLLSHLVGWPNFAPVSAKKDDVGKYLMILCFKSADYYNGKQT